MHSIQVILQDWELQCWVEKGRGYSDTVCYSWHHVQTSYTWYLPSNFDKIARKHMLSHFIIALAVVKSNSEGQMDTTKLDKTINGSPVVEIRSNNCATLVNYYGIFFNCRSPTLRPRGRKVAGQLRVLDCTDLGTSGIYWTTWRFSSPLLNLREERDRTVLEQLFALETRKPKRLRCILIVVGSKEPSAGVVHS